MIIVNTNTTDQSIRFWAYDSDGAAVTGEAYNSDGMAVSVVVRRKGRIASTTSLTLVARSGAGVHTDSALTEVGSGEYVVDLPDSYFSTDGDHVSLTVASTAITGTVVVESLSVVTDKLTTERLAKIDGTMQAGADGDTGKVLSGQIDDVGTNVQTLVDSVTTTVVTLWANLTAMITGSGTTAAFTVKAMENATAGGSGGSVNVLPATGIVADRAAGITLTPVVGETISQSITLYQTDGTTAVDVSGKTLAIVFETMSGVDVAVVASGNITISGDDSNVLTFAYPSAVTATERVLRFAIRDAASPLTLYLQGVCSVGTAPRVDT